MSADALGTPRALGSRVSSVLRPGARRVRAGWLPILQSSLGAGIAWFVAYDVVGHPQPFFAPIASVLALGVSLGQRMSRTLQLLGGVLLGVLVGDGLLLVIGTGAAQLMLFVGVAMAVALLLSNSPLTINQAAVSAVLLATIAPAGQATNVGLSRFIDAFIGAAVGLVINGLLLPVNPLTIARRASGAMFDELSATLHDIAAGLAAGDRDGTVAALNRARRLDDRLGAFDAEVGAAQELASMAPIRRPLRARVQRYSDALPYVDYTVRNTRVLGRRAVILLDQHEAGSPDLVAAVRQLAAAVQLLHVDFDRDPSFAASRRGIVAAVHQAGDVSAWRALSLPHQFALEQVRATSVDLLRATGLTVAEAHAEIGGPSVPPMSSLSD